MLRPVKFDRLGLLVILGFVFALLAVGGILLTVIVWRREREKPDQFY